MELSRSARAKDRTVTFAQLNDEVLSVAGATNRLGLRAGARALILGTSSVDLVVGYLATLAAGGTPGRLATGVAWGRMTRPGEVAMAWSGPFVTHPSIRGPMGRRSIEALPVIVTSLFDDS